MNDVSQQLYNLLNSKKKCGKTHTVCKSILSLIRVHGTQIYDNHFTVDDLMKKYCSSYAYCSILKTFYLGRPMTDENIFTLEEKIKNANKNLVRVEYNSKDFIKLLCDLVYSYRNMEHILDGPKFYINAADGYFSYVGISDKSPAIDGMFYVIKDTPYILDFFKSFARGGRHYRQYSDNPQNKRINKKIKWCLDNNKVCEHDLLAITADIINCRNLQKILDKKIIITGKQFKKFIKNYKFDELLSLILASGYNITYEDVLNSIKYRVTIPKIKDFDIVFDTDIAMFSAKYNFHEYHKIFNYEYTVESLHEACKGCVFENVRYIINTGILPDIKCLEYVCEKNDYHLIKYFVEKYKINATSNCIEKFIMNGKNKSLQILYSTLEEK